MSKRGLKVVACITGVFFVVVVVFFFFFGGGAFSGEGGQLRSAKQARSAGQASQGNTLLPGRKATVTGLSRSSDFLS